MAVIPGASLFISQLPTEIIHEIFNAFSLVYYGTEGPGGRHPIQVRDDEETMIRRQTLQSLRLTCRSFSAVASCLLLPFLTVNLSEESLSRAQEICAAPALAPHLQGIQVNLRTYSKELAKSLEWFAAYGRQQLDVLEDESTFYADEDCYKENKKFDDAVKVWHDIRQALTNTASSTADATDHERLLHRAHAEYRKRYEEQVRLISSGLFCQTLARATSTLPCSEHVHVFDSIKRPFPPDQFTSIIANQDKMIEYMVSPQSWKEVERIEHSSTLQAAAILTELPMAINAAGGRMLSLSIACFPRRNNYMQLFKNLGDKYADALSALTRSCHSLNTFHFEKSGILHRGLRPGPLPQTEKVYMDDCLRAMIASDNLEDLYLGFSAFSRSYGTSALRYFYQLSGVLSSVQSRRLRRITVTHASLSFIELETLAMATDENVEDFTLISVELLTGSWADFLDVLRPKTATSCQARSCAIELHDLYGGEFIAVTGTDQEAPGAKNHRHAQIVEAEMYLSGKRSVNTLRGGILQERQTVSSETRP